LVVIGGRAETQIPLNVNAVATTGAGRDSWWGLNGNGGRDSVRNRAATAVATI